MWFVLRGCICISNVRARTCHPLENNLHRAVRQQSGCCTEIESHRLLAQRTTNAMLDNTSGVAVPLATAACLAVSAGSFILGRGFDQRRRRGPATTLQDAEFVMVPQLAAGKHEVVTLDLCTVLLMDDSRYNWLVLVPRRPDLVEVVDLPPELQWVLWEEVAAAAAAVRQLPGVQKLNIAAIGNICSQLHVHVTGRYPGDAAWPGPCYGVGTAEPYKGEQLQQLISQLKSAIQQRDSSSKFNQRRD